MKGCATAGAGVGFKDDQDQMMEKTPLVGGCSAGGCPRGCFSHKAEVQHSWPLLAWCWGHLGVPWSTTTREKGEVWVCLSCGWCCSALKGVFRQEAFHFPLVCPCVWSEDLESTRPSRQGWKPSRKLSVFPWLPLLFLPFFSVCSNFYWQPSLPLRAEMLRLGITLESVGVQIGCSHLH